MTRMAAILAETQEFSELMHTADMARAYLSITESMGASQQLLAFINHDGKFGSEIGLESFENLSTTAQHEILISKLNPDILETMAMESLALRINKMSKWLMKLGMVGLGGSIIATGASSTVPYRAFAIGGLSLTAIITGAITEHVNNNRHGVISVVDFRIFQKAADNFVREEILIANQIPSSPDSDVWDNFKSTKNKEAITKSIIKLIEKLTEKRIEADSSLKITEKTTNADRSVTHASDWDVHSLKAAVQWITDTITKVHKLGVSHGHRLSEIEKWASSPEAARDQHAKDKFRLISNAINNQFDSFVEAHRILNWGEGELNRVGKLFTEVKK